MKRLSSSSLSVCFFIDLAGVELVPQRPVSRIQMSVAMLIIGMVAGCVVAPKLNNASVAVLDLARYFGERYEIARFDYSFERGVKKSAIASISCLGKECPHCSLLR